ILKSKLHTKRYEKTAAQTICLLVYLEFGNERLLIKRLEREPWLRESVQTGPFSVIWFYDRNYSSAPVGRIEREPFRIMENSVYASYDFTTVSWMLSSLAEKSD